MRIPFLGRKADAPTRIPLSSLLPVSFVVYFRAGGSPAPEPESLQTIILAWMEANVSEPLRPALRSLVDQEMMILKVGESEELPPPPMEMLQYMGGGEEELRRLTSATHLVFLGVPDQPGPPHAGLWCAIAAARAVAEAVDGVIFDPELPRLLPLSARIEPLPAGGKVEVTEHIMIPFSVDRRGQGWMTTKGMAKFGLPELEIRDVPPSVAEMLMAVVNGMARHLIDRTARLVGPGDPPCELVLEPEIRFGLSEMAGDAVEVPEGVRGWTTLRLQYNPGRRGSTSFLTLLPPHGFRGNQGVWLYSLLEDLFGGEDTLRMVEADSEAMEAAHKRAVEELPEARRRFQAGLQPGETLYVKHGFPTGDAGHEYMWLVVNTWSGDQLCAQIANDPQMRMDLRAGQEVDLRESDIFDWMLTGRNGDREGGYTVAVVEREGQGGGE